MKRRNETGSSRTPSRLAHRARPVRQCQTGATLSRLLPPHPATPGSGCLQLHPAATTTKRWTVSHLHPQTTAPRGAPEAEQERQAHDRAHDHRYSPNHDGLITSRLCRRGDHQASPSWPLTCAVSDGKHRPPTGRIAISGPSTSTKEFGLCVVSSTRGDVGCREGAVRDPGARGGCTPAPPHTRTPAHPSPDCPLCTMRE